MIDCKRFASRVEGGGPSGVEQAGNLEPQLINVMIIIAILMPALYFLIKRRWIGFWLTLLAMAYSAAMVCTVVLSPVLLLLWGAASTAAVLDLVYGTVDREEQSHLPRGKD